MRSPVQKTIVARGKIDAHVQLAFIYYIGVPCDGLIAPKLLI